LITGASIGIGREFARIHAAKGDTVILAARNAAALEALKAELEQAHGIAAHVFTVDLTADGAPRALHDRIKAAGLQVDVLINNAGFSQHGFFHETDLDTSLRLVQLNISALMSLTHHVLPEMIARGSGRVLNVGSTAGMVPGPLQATYHASKAFVNSFSLALANELEGTGVTVTVLAPGAVATEFFERGDMANMTGVQNNMADPAEVARLGHDAMLRGDLLVINELKLRLLLRFVQPFLPRRKVLSMARAFAEKPAAE
jgi:short-subunit dehydrogenase